MPGPAVAEMRADKNCFPRRLDKCRQEQGNSLLDSRAAAEDTKRKTRVSEIVKTKALHAVVELADYTGSAAEGRAAIRPFRRRLSRPIETGQLPLLQRKL